MKQTILRSMLLIVLTVISGCSGPRQETQTPTEPTQPPITYEVPTVTSALTESTTEIPTMNPTEVPTESPTEASTELATESTSLYFNEVIIDPTPSVVATIATAQKPTVAQTDAPTQKVTVAPTETPTQKATVAPTETPTQEYCYGICIKDTEIESKGRVFFLHAGQKVAIINLYENNLEIQWYGDSAWVKADAIDILDENFIPDFASGQWAGAISKR